VNQLKNFAEVNLRLAEFVERANRPGGYSLDRMWKIMEALDNPQERLKVIHVAGTSGKTSTSYYAAALLQAAGKKVGLTVSPHVSEVNERLQINLVPLPEADFCRALSAFLELIDQHKLQPTYFELLVAFAYWAFTRQHCDYAVVEVGLGGLHDGTNVVRRPDKICVIADIGLDHMRVLGNSLAEIAEQKAGIIQSNNDTFCYRQSDEINRVIAERATAQHAKLHSIESVPPLPELDFLPLFQQRNFGLAQAAVDFALMRDDQPRLTVAQLQIAGHTPIPARMEIFHRAGKTIILDGAHNAQKLQVLVKSIQAQFPVPAQPVAVLVSFTASREEQLADGLNELKKLSTCLIATAFRQTQDLPHTPIEPNVIEQEARELGFAQVESIENLEQAFAKLLQRPEPILLITGSFYLCSSIRARILKP